MQTKLLAIGAVGGPALVAASAPWWAPLVVQVVSMVLTYAWGRLAERKKKPKPIPFDQLPDPLQDRHGGDVQDDRDQT